MVYCFIQLFSPIKRLSQQKTPSPVPLFDVSKRFYAIRSDRLYPVDTPSVEEFISRITSQVSTAEDDYRHVKYFLWSKCRKSEATFNKFRSEAERFLLWALLIRKQSISLMKKSDIEAYVDFVVSPPSNWIGTKVCPRFRLKDGVYQVNPEWKPFVAKISKSQRKTFERNNPSKKPTVSIKDYHLEFKSIQEVFSNLNVLYEHLVEEDFAFGNAVSAVKKSSPYLIKDVTNESVHRLSDEQWDYVLSNAEKKAAANPSWERILFIIACMKSLYLRLSELSVRDNWVPIMGHFYRDKSNEGYWWLTVFGKGNKKRKVSVPEDFKQYLIRYRESRGLEGMPSVDENTPLIEPKHAHNRGLKSRTIALLAQKAFDLAEHELRKDGKHEDADILTSASSHWLRHTGASMDVEHRPIKDLAADLGHDRISTTDRRYVHADDAERAKSGKSRKV